MLPRNAVPFVLLAVAAALGLPLAAGGDGTPGTLESRVVDAAHRPIAGAEVWEVGVSRIDPYRGNIYPPPVLCAVSGEDGRFSTRGIDRGPADLEVCHEGYLIARLPLAAGLPAEIVLQRAARLSGRILSPDGSPVPGARVLARTVDWAPGDVVEDMPPPRPCPRSESTGETTTDAQGRFTLDSLWPGKYDVSATAAGFRRSDSGRHFELGLGQKIAEVEVWLAPGAVVRGRVKTSRGDPVAGAEVTSDEDDAKAVTDARGVYRLTGVSTGRHWIGVVAAKDEILTRSSFQEVEVAPGENRLDFTVPPPGREVRGRVLAPDGTPVGGALLQAGDACPSPHLLVKPHTAPDGSFVVHLPEGTGRLVAIREGYSPGEVDLPGDQPVKGAVIRLHPDRGLSGRLLGAEPGSRGGGIVLLEAWPQAGPCQFIGQVESDGRYRFGGLWPGEWKVTMMATQLLHGQVKLTPGVEGHLDFSLRPTLEVRGRVVDGEASPVAGARVRFRRAEGPSFDATSGEDGTFAVRLESGRWTAWVERAGFGATQGEPVEVAGPTPRTVELVLPRGALLRARVRGVPAGQVVQLLSARGQSNPFLLFGEVDGEGLFRIAGLPPGDWKIQAQIGLPPLPASSSRQWLEEVTRQVTVEPGTRELQVDLALPQGGLTLSGRVTNPHGGVLKVGLRRLADPEAEFFSYPASDEPFRFTGLPSGRYLLQVQVGDRSPFEQELDLDADREISLELPPEFPGIG